MKTEFNKKELEIIDKFKKEGLKNGIKCGFSSKEEKAKCEAAISNYYIYSKINKPKYFIWVRSPLEAMKLISNFEKLGSDTNDVGIIKKRLEEKHKKTAFKYFETNFWGQEDNYWIYFYKCGEELGCKYAEKEKKILDGFLDISNAALWWWPFENVCIISERQIELHLNNKLQKHCETGPAWRFADGYEMYFLNNVRMKKEHVLTPAEKINLESVLNEKNTDVQRELIRKVGYDRMLKACNAKIIEYWVSPQGNEYTMRNMKIGNINRRYLCYEHASMPGIFYAKAVPPEVKNIIQMRGFQTKVVTRDELRAGVDDKKILENLPNWVK